MCHSHLRSPNRYQSHRVHIISFIYPKSNLFARSAPSHYLDHFALSALGHNNIPLPPRSQESIGSATHTDIGLQSLALCECVHMSACWRAELLRVLKGSTFNFKHIYDANNNNVQTFSKCIVYDDWCL